VEVNTFEKFLIQLSGNFYQNNRAEMVAVLWASVYVYDFLISVGLISQSTYDSFITSSKILKGKVIVNYTRELWNANFVHYWKKPDSVSETEFLEEAKIFSKSLNIKEYKFEKVKKEISDELKNIGELSDYVINASKENDNYKNSPNAFDKILDRLRTNSENDTDSEMHSNTLLIRTEPKIGRNDPCSCGSGKKYKKCCGK